MTSIFALNELFLFFHYANLDKHQHISSVYHHTHTHTDTQGQFVPHTNFIAKCLSCKPVQTMQGIKHAHAHAHVNFIANT